MGKVERCDLRERRRLSAFTWFAYGKAVEPLCKNLHISSREWNGVRTIPDYHDQSQRIWEASAESQASSREQLSWQGETCCQSTGANLHIALPNLRIIISNFIEPIPPLLAQKKDSEAERKKTTFTRLIQGSFMQMKLRWRHVMQRYCANWARFSFSGASLSIRKWGLGDVILICIWTGTVHRWHSLPP